MIAVSKQDFTQILHTKTAGKLVQSGPIFARH